MQRPLVSIVVLNWNGEKHVHRCIQHVILQSYKPIEVIVVDNGSVDGSVERIKRKSPNCVFLENEKNEGYAAGMNRGISVCGGEYVVPLNQDICLDTNYVTLCVDRMIRDPSIGAIGGRVFSWIGDKLTNKVREGEGEQVLLRKRFQGYGGRMVDGETWTFAPAGSFPFFRRSMLEDLHETSGYYYDEGFGTGWEDIDLFFRMHLRGWQCLFLPSACGWHVGSGSVDGQDKFLSKDLQYQVRILRNRYFTMAKNLPLPTLRWLSPYLVLTEAALIPYFLLRSPKTVLGLFAAWLQFLAELPLLIQKRRRIQQSLRVPKTHLNRFFVVF